jgi:hypothetical protein
MAVLIASGGGHANHEDWGINVNAVQEIVAGERKGWHTRAPDGAPAADKICCQHEPKMMMCSKATWVYW